jgi:hypothetical protein
MDLVYFTPFILWMMSLSPPTAHGNLKLEPDIHESVTSHHPIIILPFIESMFGRTLRNTVHEKNRLGIPPPNSSWHMGIWLCVARVLALGFSESYNNNNRTSDLSCLHHRLPNLEALHSLFRRSRDLAIWTLFTRGGTWFVNGVH